MLAVLQRLPARILVSLAERSRPDPVRRFQQPVWVVARAAEFLERVGALVPPAAAWVVRPSAAAGLSG